MVYCIHYSDLIMSAMASQITGIATVCSTVCSGADQRKHQSSASLAFVRGNPPVTSGFPHIGPVTWKMLPSDDIILNHSEGLCNNRQNVLTILFCHKIYLQWIFLLVLFTDLCLDKFLIFPILGNSYSADVLHFRLKACFNSTRILILNYMRWWWDCLIFIIEIPILV